MRTSRHVRIPLLVCNFRLSLCVFPASNMESQGQKDLTDLSSTPLWHYSLPYSLIPAVTTLIPSPRNVPAPQGESGCPGCPGEARGRRRRDKEHLREHRSPRGLGIETCLDPRPGLCSPIHQLLRGQRLHSFHAGESSSWWVSKR